MPRLLTFANAMRSRGDGFVKTPSSGMWQCTLMTEKRKYLAAEQAPQGEQTDTTPMATGKVTQQLQKKGETIFLHPSSSHSPHQFQLISTSSRYLCSILVLACPYPLTEVHIIRLEKMPFGTKPPDGVGIAFALATEATWADVLLFLRQLSSMYLCAAEDSHTTVWQLQEVASEENGINVGAGLYWHVIADLSLCAQVQHVFAEEKTLYVALETTQEEALFTPPGRFIPKTIEPPPLLMKQASDGASPCGLPQRDLLAAFTEAHDDEAARETTTEVIATAATETAVNRESGEQRPTYAEMLIRGLQQQNQSVKPKGEPIRRWRQRLIQLRDELCRGTCVEAMVRIAKGHLLQHEEGEQQQQQVDVGRDGAIAFLLAASMREMMCDLLLDVAASWAVGGRKSRRVALHLRKCIDGAQAVSSELTKWTGEETVLQFPQCILQLRLVRHQCCAMALMKQSIEPTLLQDALGVGKRLSALLRGLLSCGWDDITCGDKERNTSCDNLDGFTDSQLVSGVLLAALSFLEISLLEKKNSVQRDDMTCAAGSLLLWLRDISGGAVYIPVALTTRLEDEVSGTTMAAGQLRHLLQRCEDQTSTQQKKTFNNGGVELCCGVVRTVSCSAVLDQNFARMVALFRRLGVTEGVNGNAM